MATTAEARRALESAIYDGRQAQALRLVDVFARAVRAEAVAPVLEAMEPLLYRPGGGQQVGSTGYSMTPSLRRELNDLRDLLKQECDR